MPHTQYSCLEEDEKKRALDLWEKRWIKFVKAVATSVDSLLET